jgi:hypothetical protein
MKKRDENYKDFSNRRPYNDIPCKPGEVLVPFVVDEDGKGKDPIGTTLLEDTAFLGMVIKDIIIEVRQKNSKYGQLIAQDYGNGKKLSITQIKTVNQETKKNYKTSAKKHINYCYCPSIGKSVAIISDNSSYEKLSDSIKNKFPNEPLPKDGRIINYTLKAGNIKDIFGLRRMDFVIDKDGKLIIGKKHQTLGNAEDVLAAGQLKVDGYGMIRRIDNNSGHYRPTAEEASKYPELFEQAGFNLDKAWLYINKYTINYSGIIIKSEIVVHKKIK